MDVKQKLTAIRAALKSRPDLTDEEIRLLRRHEVELTSPLFKAARKLLTQGQGEAGLVLALALFRKLSEGYPRGSCVIYCRVSTHSQAKTGTGLWRQLKTSMRYAEDHGLSVDAVFSEVASGIDLLPVRATAQRIAEARNCPLLCEDYSRWSRKGAIDVPPQYVVMTSEAEIELEEQLRKAFTPAQRYAVESAMRTMEEQALAGVH